MPNAGMKAELDSSATALFAEAFRFAWRRCFLSTRLLRFFGPVLVSRHVPLAIADIRIVAGDASPSFYGVRSCSNSHRWREKYSEIRRIR